MQFQLTILGSNAALPAHNRHPAAQVLQIHNNYYLIDCGEGTQMRMNDFEVKRNKIDHIFISHLHGDHVFGLIGLLTSYNLNGRKSSVDIYSPPGLEKMIRVQLEICSTDLDFPVRFRSVSATGLELIFADQTIEVFAFPLLHRIPTFGFLFREKPLPKNIRSEKILEYKIPYSIIPRIKWGAHFATDAGKVIRNDELCLPAPRPRSYCYCSDTAYFENIVPLISKVDLLYHEATFLHEHLDKAQTTMHSTAQQAARLAGKARAGKLLIGHFSSRYKELNGLLEEARTIFPNTDLALEGLQFDLPYRKTLV